MRKIKIMVVDDSVKFTRSLEAFLAIDDRIEVLTSAHSGEEALRRSAIECLDLVLTDLKMPGMDGLGVTRAQVS